VAVVYLFALLGISSVLLSCARALDARLSDKPSAPKFLSCFVYVLGFLGFLGYFAHPFETYLNNRFYDHMMKRVRAARYLASLSDYPPDYMLDQYGFDPPPADDLDGRYTFKDWRNHEYTKLGL
jgi:hypothetical protein